MSRPTVLSIDLAALQYNLQRVRQLAPGRSIIAMVKANAYGHGLVPIAQALHQAEALGVASIDEGLVLRQAGITQPIVLMEGLFYADEIAEAAKNQFSLVVHHLPGLEMLEKTSVSHVFPVWLKVNTGMNRLGFQPEAVAEVYKRLHALKVVQQPMGLMTHFAEADDVESDATKKQQALFEHTVSAYPGPRSMANSAGIVMWPATHADWVRPGLMLYGASPMIGQMGEAHDLKPVMTLSSRIIAITEVKAGSKIGYGGTWVAEEDLKVGVVGVGYGDGYPQFARSGTPVWVNGTLCPLVGRVSMDMLAVDLRAYPNARVDERVVLWGRELPVELVARHNHTSAYEILTRVTDRPRQIP